jgi:DNA-binding NarL/FixJ family response regulator
VLQLLAEGRTTSEIATDLHLTEMTVRAYVKAFLVTLGATHRAHAVGIGYQSGLLPLQEAS